MNDDLTPEENPASPIRTITGSLSNLMDKSNVPERAQKNCLYLLCYKICSHWLFTVVITLLIGANTVVLAMDKYPVDPGY